MENKTQNNNGASQSGFERFLHNKLVHVLLGVPTIIVFLAILSRLPKVCRRFECPD